MHSPMRKPTHTRKSHFRPIWRVVLGVLLALFAVFSGGRASIAQDPDDDPSQMSIEAAQEAADALMARMSVADLIGQLFVVTFSGTDASHNT